MTTDLRGQPLGRQPELQLNLWQKRQATLIDYFSSLDYLKGLLGHIDTLIQGADISLDAAMADGRDRFIANARWGTRDTAANWSTYGYPALLDWKQSVQRQISLRAVEAYSTTGAQFCARKLSELSMLWASEKEEDDFKRSIETVYSYASHIDRLMQRPQSANDGVYYTLWHGFSSDTPSRGTSLYGDMFSRLPRFRIRTDVVVETDQHPPRTGIYVPQDDPYGTLQFGWTGGEANGSLDDCRTFNDLGRQIVRAVGRRNLWNDSPELLTYVRHHFPEQFESTLKEAFGPTYSPALLSEPENAVFLLEDKGLTKVPCKWYFGEKIEGAWEDAAEAEAAAIPPAFRQQRVPAGEPCPADGYWFTPAQPDSRRRFQRGEVFPQITGSDYGDTFWLWAVNQTP